MTPRLTIAVPSVVDRAAGREQLLAKLDRQIRALGDPPVELLCVVDNRHRSIGHKRQACLDAATGEYIAQVDDDDDIAPDYVAALLAGCATGVDVVVFAVDAIVQVRDREGRAIGAPRRGRVCSSLAYPNEDFHPGGRTRRRPIQIHAWRRTLAQRARFPDANRNEDFTWAAQLWPHATSEHTAGTTPLYVYRKNRPPPTS